jgi:acyl carrier protein
MATTIMSEARRGTAVPTMSSDYLSAVDLPLLDPRAQAKARRKAMVGSDEGVTLEGEVISIIREYFRIPSKDLVGSTELSEDLDLDSLDLTLALIDIEESFGVEFPDDAAGRFRTVADIVSAMHAT